MVPCKAQHNSVVCLLPNRYCFRVVLRGGGGGVMLPERQYSTQAQHTQSQRAEHTKHTKHTEESLDTTTHTDSTVAAPSSSSAKRTAASPQRGNVAATTQRSIEDVLMAKATKQPKDTRSARSTKGPVTRNNDDDNGDDDEDEHPPKKAALGVGASAAQQGAQQASSTFASLPTRLFKGAVALPVPKGWHCLRDSVLCFDFGDVEPSHKIAAFDFDGCLASTSVRGFDPNAWRMRFQSVPEVVKQYAADGYKIVIFTNESIERFKNEGAIRKAVMKKIGRVKGFLEAVNIPTQVFCMLRKDEYRKPSTAIWAALESRFNGGVPISRQQSFYVGDAAGRQHDHSADDKLFARNVGVRFMTEKECFLGKGARSHK
ncbi:hypothetical protein, variant [Salpingoeca rosetta]|nr:hypothetical protein, variant [Salpingoeca rosetta]EGD81657.1 hypothetical protein, variant [Salpingoeca rosetta]|eukprot:XP_004996861.1 hypothetical protein, variant [Salpingoeca rosetta]